MLGRRGLDRPRRNLEHPHVVVRDRCCLAVRWVPPTSAISPKNAPGVELGERLPTASLIPTVPCASWYERQSQGVPVSMIVAPAGYACAVITPTSARAPGFDSADNSGAGATFALIGSREPRSECGDHGARAPSTAGTCARPAAPPDGGAVPSNGIPPALVS